MLKVTAEMGIRTTERGVLDAIDPGAEHGGKHVVWIGVEILCAQRQIRAGRRK